MFGIASAPASVYNQASLNQKINCSLFGLTPLSFMAMTFWKTFASANSLFTFRITLLCCGANRLAQTTWMRGTIRLAVKKRSNSIGQLHPAGGLSGDQTCFGNINLDTVMTTASSRPYFFNNPNTTNGSFFFLPCLTRRRLLTELLQASSALRIICNLICN